MSTIEFIFDEGRNLDNLALSSSKRFSDRDIAFLRSRSGLEKARQGIQRVPYNLRILINLRNTQLLNEPGLVQPQPGVISLRLNHNSTTEDAWVPLTSWMMMHRMGHILQVSSEQLGESSDFIVWQGVVRLWNQLYPLYPIKAPTSKILHDISWGNWAEAQGVPGYVKEPESQPTVGKPREYSWANHLNDINRLKRANDALAHTMSLMCAVMTMKSARLNLLQNELDITCELLAQYLIQGRISFREVTPDIWTQVRGLVETRAYGKKLTSTLPLEHDADLTAVNTWLEDYRQRVEASFDRALKGMVGGVWEF